MQSHHSGCILPIYSVPKPPQNNPFPPHWPGCCHAKPTKAMPAMPNCIQMQLIATHVFPPFWLYIAYLRRPKTTSEQSVPSALACMLPTYYMADLQAMPKTHAVLLRPGRPVFLGPIAPQRHPKPRTFSLGYRLAKQKLVTCNLTPRLVRNLGSFLQLISTTSPLHPFFKCL